tara:strand:- start:1115 stop:1276 length:162 start_codon:yes stop_codon:yes gene_type:complete
MDKIEEILFSMVRFAILKTLSLISVFLLLLIVAISPVYVTMGLMKRQMTEKSK